MKKISKKYSEGIAQGMFVLTVAAFIVVAMMFGSCSSSTDRDNYKEEFRYNNTAHMKGSIGGTEQLSTFTFEGRRYTIWSDYRVKTSQILHIENLNEEDDN